MSRNLSLFGKTFVLILALSLSIETAPASAKRQLEEDESSQPAAKRVRVNGDEVFKNNHITKMDLSDDQELTNIDFIRFFPNLRELNLSYCWNLGDNYAAVSRLPMLEELNLYNIGLTEVKHIKPLVHLTSLALTCPDIKKAMKFIVKLPNLKKLDIAGGNIMGLEKISQLTSLESLRLRGVFNDDGNDDEEFVYPSLDFLTPLINLRKLDLASNDYIFYIKPVVHLPKLTHLDLSGCKSIKDLCLLKHLKSLTHLDLRYINPGHIQRFNNEVFSKKELLNLKELILSSDIKDIPCLPNKAIVYKNV
jgi:hypothetical protein